MGQGWWGTEMEYVREDYLSKHRDNSSGKQHLLKIYEQSHSSQDFFVGSILIIKLEHEDTLPILLYIVV